jgi:predicted O-methyltransferase YrrM
MPMTLIDPQVAAYLEQLVPPRHPRTAAIEEEATRTRFPIIGPACGHLCYLLTRLTGARTVFELGSGYGYSTGWFARAVKENGGGTVHHVVWDADLSSKAQEYLEALELADQVQFHVGEAVAALRASAGRFDVIFNDIDKQGYPDALAVIAEKLEPGGLLIADNLLWSGQIFDPQNRTPATEGIRTFTQLVTEDPAWTSSLIPIRDGLLVARRSS